MRLGGVAVGFIGVLQAGDVIALTVMLGRGAVRLRSAFVVFGSFRVGGLGHGILL
jgi:hypothetical protein